MQKISLILAALLVLPIVSAQAYYYDPGYYGHTPSYNSVSSNVQESEYSRVRETEDSRTSYPSYGYYGYGYDNGNNGYSSEYHRSREIEFGRSYSASYQATMNEPYYSIYNGYNQYSPRYNRNYQLNDYYGNGPYGVDYYHDGTLPYGYGYNYYWN